MKIKALTSLALFGTKTRAASTTMPRHFLPADRAQCKKPPRALSVSPPPTAPRHYENKSLNIIGIVRQKFLPALPDRPGPRLRKSDLSHAPLALLFCTVAFEPPAKGELLSESRRIHRLVGATIPRRCSKETQEHQYRYGGTRDRQLSGRSTLQAVHVGQQGRTERIQE